MNAVDASAHYTQRTETEILPSLLTVILDTNPAAWSTLHPILPLPTALSHLLLFLNAHLAFSNTNKVALIAAHPTCARLLYPSPSPVNSLAGRSAGVLTAAARALSLADGGFGGDSPMGAGTDTASSTPGGTPPPSNGLGAGGDKITDVERDANKYRQFRMVEDAVVVAVRNLFLAEGGDMPGTAGAQNGTGDVDMRDSMMAGALSMALSYISRVTAPIEDSSIGGTTQAGGGGAGGGSDGKDGAMTMNARILIVSVSGDQAFQYIPIMNCIFAAQKKKIPIDVCKIAGETVFLQQASDATSGIYMKLKDPKGLLQYLMMSFLPDQTSRKHLVLPTQVNVDFRAACFCHKRVVDIGFVCSICLSIFCSPPEGAICSTCETKLDITNLGHGGKPAVLMRKKKKKKKKTDAVGGEA